MDKLTWEIFKETGDIRYFLLNKRLEESGKDENSRYEGNNS